MLIDLLVSTVCLVVPSVSLFWLARSRARSRLYLLSVALLVGVVLLVLIRSVLGAWYAVGGFWPWLFGTAYVIILALRARRLPGLWLPRRGTAELYLGLLNLAILILTIPVVSALAKAEDYPAPVVRLAAPLRGGTFQVLGGGASWAVNYHHFVAHQRYALDITRTGALGLRASVIVPVELADYRALGSEIVAPCAGEVIATRDGLPDRPPGDPDLAAPFGNHAIVFCSGHSVVLAHLAPGSLAVAAGESVVPGDRIGRVGNSGSSLEPHLHMHAVRGRSIDGLGVAAPMLIDGRFLIKGDKFSG
jgi:murein DD-endopeptidase MepM/ murein hydrolase activator NlpD